MKNHTILTLSLLATALTASVVHAEASVFTPVQKEEIEQIIHNYLAKTHSEVLIEASQNLQNKQQAQLQKQAKSAIAENGTLLVSGNLTIAGNPKGDVTLIEFFDYQCSHCIKMKPIITDLIKKNPNLRVVFKEFPIFGKESEMASRVAIVAANHSKYLDFQTALFQPDVHVDEKSIMAAAEKVGLDMATLKTEMDSKLVTAELELNHRLAESIHMLGTPAFIIVSTPGGKFKPGAKTKFIPGASTEATLQVMIDAVHKK